MNDWPTGTVTFLLTDVEGSTRLWQEHPDVMADVIERHDLLIAEAVAKHGGTFVKSKGEGDSTFSVFTKATDAVAAAIDVQRCLQSEPWLVPIAARTGVHTGEAELRHGDYYGTTVNSCARLRSTGHGGQIVVSQATEELVTEHLPADATLRDLGRHGLRDLDRPVRIFQLVVAGLRDDFPDLATRARVPSNLPTQRSSFIGRVRESEEVVELVHRHRIVTLTGIGGCGKTRLAIHTANQMLEEFDDGVFFCDLAPIADPEAVDRAVAQSVRMTGSTGDTRADLLTFLSPRRTLLVLDNCEHVLDAAADIVDAILESGEHIRVLATSREGLRVEGEQAYAVPSLVADDASSEAVRLFTDRARQERPSFEPAEHAAVVLNICSRLDGIPLAIELAAARVAHLTPEQIEQRLTDRFRLLTGGRRRVQRQQTLAAALDWSFEMLTPDEQALLRRLAVFAGGSTLEAAEGICSEDAALPVLDLLGSLVAKSLVTTEHAQRGGVRYRLLETVRLYAEEKLVDAGEAERFRGRHRDWFLRWAEAPTELYRLLGFDHAEIANIRSAIEWSAGEGRFDLCARLSTAVYPTMDDFPMEGRAWLDLGAPAFDELAVEHQIGWLTMRAWNGYTLLDLSRIGEVNRAIQTGGDADFEALVFAHGLRALGYSYQVLVARTAGADPGVLLSMTLESLAEYRRRGARMDSLMASFWLEGGVLMNLDELERVVAWNKEACEAKLPAPEFEILFVSNYAMSSVALHLLGRHQEAYEDACKAAEGTEGFWQTTDYVYSFVAVPRAIALAALDRADEARDWIRELLPDVTELRLPLVLNSVVVGLAAIAGCEGDWERAAVLHEATRSAGAFFRDPTGFALFRHYDRRIEEHLAPYVLERCRKEGAEMSLPDALALGLEPTTVRS